MKVKFSKIFEFRIDEKENKINKKLLNRSDFVFIAAHIKNISI